MSSLILCFTFYFQTECRVRKKVFLYVEKIYICKSFLQTGQSLENKNGRNCMLEPELGFLVLVDVFDLRLLRPGPWPRIAPTNQSHSPLCIATQITECYWSEETSSHSLGFTRDARNMGRADPHVPYLNNGSH
jgi:hypothetical protein